MAKKTYIIEWRGGAPVKVHIVATADYHESGFYRQTVSMNAFRNNAHRHFYEQTQKGVRNADHFGVQWQEEWDSLLESEARVAQTIAEHGRVYVSQYASIPHVEYANPADFYAVIGYDPKKKNFG